MVNGLGAQHFFVPGLYHNKNVAGNRNEVCNTALIATLQRLSFNVTYFDPASVYTSLINGGINHWASCLQSIEGLAFSGQM